MITNDEIAALLDEVADLLEAQHANLHRVRAYRDGAQKLREIDRDVVRILAAQGIAGLERIPGIGTGLAAAIEEVARSGRLRLLDHLHGEVSPAELFTTVPGVGIEFAHRLHDWLGIDTLEELETAAHDGRLDRVPGFGHRRVQAVRAYLDSHFRRVGRASRSQRAAARPSVTTLLAVDAEYRRRAAAGELKTITPRRFNPEGASWLPVLHVERDGWSLTALFSNTARAHRLGRTHDWVVIYADGAREYQCTVVTEPRGILAGRRVVRGREAECLTSYGSAALPSPPQESARARTPTRAVS